MKYLKPFNEGIKLCEKYEKALKEVQIFKNILQDLHDDHFHINYNIGLSNVDGIHSATEILRYDSPIGMGASDQEEIEKWRKNTNNWIERYPKSDVYYSIRIVCDKVVDRKSVIKFNWEDISNEIHHLLDESSRMGYKDYVLGFYSGLRKVSPYTTRSGIMVSVYPDVPKKYFDLDKLDKDNPEMYYILNIVLCKDINTINAHYRDDYHI